MSVRDTGETPVPPSGPFSGSTPARPSWDVAPRPAAPRPAASPRPVPAEASKRHYAAAPPPPTAQAPADETVRYDLAGNPVASSGSPSRAPYNQAMPSQATTGPGVWPPPPTASYGSSGVLQSGENGTDRVARLRWNWGAFLLPFWWSCFNGQRSLAWGIFALNAAGRYIPAPLSYLLSLVYFGLCVYLGLTGHRLSWATGRAMGDYDDFIRTQRAWMIWGFAVTGLLIIAGAVFFSMFAGSSLLSGGGFGHAVGSAHPPQGGN